MRQFDDPNLVYFCSQQMLDGWAQDTTNAYTPDALFDAYIQLYNDCIACADDPEACVAMVSRLPTINRRVFLFVVSFLQIFLDEKVQAITKMTSSNLALVMAPNLLRCDSESMSIVFTNAA